MNAQLIQGPIDMGLIRQRLDRWGANQPLIKSIHLLGRPVGDARRISSGLELGIELDWVATDGGLSLWTAMQDKWRAQLERRLPYVVQLEWYRPSRRDTGRTRNTVGLYRKSA